MRRLAIASIGTLLVFMVIIQASVITTSETQEKNGQIIPSIACCPPTDLTPPVIHEVIYYPDAPEYDDYVLVVAYVTDAKSGVANVTLTYSTDLGESFNVTMSKTADLYLAEIPPQPFNTSIAFLVYAWDTAGNLAVSSEKYYVVGDFHPPVITYIEHVPALPNYNETVQVFVNVTEPSFASGVREAVLTYNNGTAWTNVTMSIEEGLYVATIPIHAYGAFVQYKVYAFDNAGNWAVMDVYSYTVQDRFLPVAMINAPTRNSFLPGHVDCEVYVYDDNFLNAELKVNDTVLATWTETGAHAYQWNTTEFSDGVYVLRLYAHDLAGNIGEAECLVTVDNTVPTVEIRSPLNGSYVRGIVFLEVSGEDSNFDEMKLTIDDYTYVWHEDGEHIYIWNTIEYEDGLYMIILSTNDKAGNEAETSIVVNVDNTAPALSNPEWSPFKPNASEQVNVSIQVLEEGSGIKNVTLWFSVNNGAWESLDMTLHEGDWTCTIPAQEENAMVEFYVECYDIAGNHGETLEKTYTVKAEDEGPSGEASGFPLNWLLFIILLIALMVGATAYVLRRRKKNE